MATNAARARETERGGGTGGSDIPCRHSLVGESKSVHGYRAGKLGQTQNDDKRFQTSNLPVHCATAILRLTAIYVNRPERNSLVAGKSALFPPAARGTLTIPSRICGLRESSNVVGIPSRVALHPPRGTPTSVAPGR